MSTTDIIETTTVQASEEVLAIHRRMLRRQRLNRALTYVAGIAFALWILVGRTSATDLDTDESAAVIVVTGVTTAERLAEVQTAISRCLEAHRNSNAVRLRRRAG